MTAERAKHRLMRWSEREARLDRAETREAVAEEIAAAIESSAPDVCTDPFCADGCPHFARRQQALGDAAIAREHGEVTSA